MTFTDEQLSRAASTCDYCGKQATCFGRYESMVDPSYACDECCGHGCEDGRCEPLKAALDACDRELSRAGAL